MKMSDLIGRLTKVAAAGLQDAEVGLAVEYIDGNSTKILRFSRNIHLMARPEEKLILLHGVRSIPLKQGEVDPKTTLVKVEPSMDTRVRELRLQKEVRAAREAEQRKQLLPGLVPSLADLPALPPLRATDLLIIPKPKPKKKKRK
jgi:hypothetical protein